MRRLALFPLQPLLLVAALVLAGVGPAGALTLDAIDAGFVTEAGGSAKGDGTISPATYNYSVGREVHYDLGFLGGAFVPMDRKNYFVFDLTGVLTPIVSASIELYAGTYESVDPSEDFALVAPSDVGAAISDAEFLLMKNLLGPSEFDEITDPAIGVATALYGNLAGGPATPLGTTSISAGDDGTTISIALDPAGVGFLNGFLGTVVIIGGSVTSVVPPGTPQQPFGLTGPDIPGGDPLTPSLVLTLPEPSTATAVALALLVVAGARRRLGCG